MTQAQTHEAVGTNRLLEMIDPSDSAALYQQGETIELGFKSQISLAYEPITHVHFPLSGVISLVLDSDRGATTEIATVGNEGLVGTTVVLGADRSAMRVFCQVPSACLRVPVAAVRALMDQSPSLTRLFLRYVEALFLQTAQSVLCNQLHWVEQRMCRWVLMTHDRVGKDEFPLSQEFLAQMLGVPRPNIEVLARVLMDAGGISYKDGIMTVLNRRTIEKATCECYLAVRTRYEQLMRQS